MSKCCLFVGITTLDLIYLAPHLPQANEKLSAIDSAAKIAAESCRFFGTRNWMESNGNSD
ncbi:hypothetical protein [Dactylococcopsis salina]|uniref:Uncharacterized protein n=1 Tax=Dactylococcopsis salina (strain PCC 8305) TaxID=13035 RepID=K9YWU8_DACS8|nr:hypothetical protein [Dactylococcopsis salina]AFZ51389.1 hypothetical protein Dacsa_2820 [Dactylococcopsis salina PCC 8305]